MSRPCKPPSPECSVYQGAPGEVASKSIPKDLQLYDPGACINLAAVEAGRTREQMEDDEA